MRRRAYLGNDSVTYAENSAGYVYLTTVEAALKEGFVRKVAETVWDVERLWKKLDAQEKQQAEKMNETLYNQRKDRLAAMRSQLNQRRASADCSNFERDFIAAAAEIIDRKESILTKNSRYGVAAMQESPAPLAPKKVTDGEN